MKTLCRLFIFLICAVFVTCKRFRGRSVLNKIELLEEDIDSMNSKILRMKRSRKNELHIFEHNINLRIKEMVSDVLSDVILDKVMTGEVSGVVRDGENSLIERQNRQIHQLKSLIAGDIQNQIKELQDEIVYSNFKILEFEKRLERMTKECETENRILRKDSLLSNETQTRPTRTTVTTTSPEPISTDAPCPPGCMKCPENQKPNAAKTSCQLSETQATPTRTTVTTTSPKPISTDAPCPPGFASPTGSDPGCMKCPENQKPNAAKTSCQWSETQATPTRTTVTTTSPKPISTDAPCPPGFASPTGSDPGCMKCPENQKPNAAKTSCQWFEDPDVVTTKAPSQCVLPVNPDLMREGNIGGIRFGSMADSRQEFNRLPSRFRFRGLFELDFKTTTENGIILYLSHKNHIDMIALYMKEGHVVYTFNCGSGPAVITTPQKYNDGKWHNVKFSRAQKQGHLQIDEERVGYGSSQGRIRSIYVVPPFYLGGIPLGIKNGSSNNLQKIYGSFVGCLRNVSLNEREFGAPTQQFGVMNCSDSMEAGSFFTADQGYVKLYDNFKVGLDLEIKVDIKPRTVSGVILALHSKGIYLVLQMVMGRIILTIDDGMRAINTTYTPQDKFALCNGQWHTIRVIMAKEELTLFVDGMPGDRGQGKAGIQAVDTNGIFYVGGVPDYTAKVFQVESSFTGCIRNLLLNGELQYLSSGDSVGNVKMDSCPVS